MAAADGTLHALQEGFREIHGLQCGFCTPGMIIRAVSAAAGDIPTRPKTKSAWAFPATFRCTGYQNIVKAIQYAAAEKRLPLREAE